MTSDDDKRSAKAQLTRARQLGASAFNEGLSSPSIDSELMEMIRHRPIGQHPAGEASSADIIKAWLRGYDLAMTQLVQEARAEAGFTPTILPEEPDDD